MSTQPYDLTSPAVPGLVRAWDRFWFEPLRPTTLGVIRIFTGLIVLYCHVLYSFQLPEFFGKDAWVNLETVDRLRHEQPVSHLPYDYAPQPNQRVFHTLFGNIEVEPLQEGSRELNEWLRYNAEWGGADKRILLTQGTPIWSIWFNVTDPTAMALVHALILVIMVMFTLGFGTRITSVLTWMATLSYIHRAQTNLFGMDTMMNILLIYLMIGPSGAALSVDRLIRRWWAARQARREGRPVPAWEPPAPSMSARLATRLIQIHFCIIYMAAGLAKLLGHMWWGGTALWLCWANYEFAPFQFALYEQALSALAQNRLLWEITLSGAVAFTLILEIGLPFMIWHPKLRWVMIIGAVMLHTGIAITMGLTGFGMLMLCMLLAFVPVETVERLLERIPALKTGFTPAARKAA